MQKSIRNVLISNKIYRLSFHFLLQKRQPAFYDTVILFQLTKHFIWLEAVPRFFSFIGFSFTNLKKGSAITNGALIFQCVLGCNGSNRSERNMFAETALLLLIVLLDAVENSKFEGTDVPEQLPIPQKHYLPVCAA